MDDAKIAEMNKMYLGRLGPTNVIAFPMQEGPYREINPSLLGDVVISLDTAAREAQEGRVSLESRFDRLLIHGILHLLGFDHERSSSRAEEMITKEEELLRLL